MFKKIANKIKEVFRKMIGVGILEEVLNVSTILTDEMQDAIELWNDMYQDKAPWLREPTYKDPMKVKSLGLPAFIASEKARMAVLELQTAVIVPTIENSSEEDGQDDIKKIDNTLKMVGSERALYLESQYKKIKQNLRTQIEYGIAKGGLVIKPYVDISNSGKVSIDFNYVQADNFYPISFGANGEITHAVFVDRYIDGKIVYTKLETHKLENDTVVIENTVYKSENSAGRILRNELGNQVSLDSVEIWNDVVPKAVIQNIDRLLFSYFKMPDANTVDTYSPLGVSGFSRAVELIKEADLQYSRMLWEFEGGELAIDVDRDLIKPEVDKNGNPIEIMNSLQRRLYRSYDKDIADTKTFYNVFNPAFRDASLLNGLNSILMRIEDVTGLSRGTLADVNTEARTATELKILKQRSYAANSNIQQAIEVALRDVVKVMDIYCDLYNIVPKGEYEMTFSWDDSILVDIDTELNKRLMLKREGLISDVELRMWYFNESEERAMDALAKIKEGNVASMESSIFGAIRS